ncbi:MAG: DUF1549 and DUF1553 domain-containing protein [Verrucomicrobia bacterium]|nr:DUF1549 and DUF1553 domain-containing protein [Verrucomicrobiota bacterium]
MKPNLSNRFRPGVLSPILISFLSLWFIPSNLAADSPIEHWAFQPLIRPAVPTINDGGWIRNPIDSFVLAKLESRNWKPAPHADWNRLLRRVYLDVIGLPPSLEKQEALLLAPSDEALDRIIDYLLSRPEYGERWARHWLDVVRYAESNGYERDAAKPFVWRYRDYVIQAFNKDKRIDRFFKEQLAGDELADANAETLIASGFNRLGHWDDEPADPETDRFDQLDDLVSTTSAAFLGVTLGCARCHDHKFDPFSARDYYSMVAIFNPLERPRDGRTELALPVGSPEEIQRLTGRDDRISALEKEAALLTKEQNGENSISPSKEFSSARDSRLSDLKQRIQSLREQTPDLPRGYFLREPAREAPITHVLLRGSPRNRGPEVKPAVPAVLASEQPLFKNSPNQTSGRRMALAEWIVSEENPLTARVWVNRIWQQHFGMGLVRTPNDFGTLGDKPTHPELLDWLAHWFTHDAGWSLKKLHKLILSSNTYRMSRSTQTDHSADDPENRFLWRLPYRRLEAEAIRDSMLAVSDRLDRTMYGHSIYPFVPRQALEGHSDPDKIWKPFDEREASRRTVYAFIKRSMVVPMLEVLDLCESTQSSAQRMVTTIAPQALTLFNGDFANRQAAHFAKRLIKEVGRSPERQIDHAYRLALCRLPTTTEKGTMFQFVDNETKRFEAESVTSPNLREDDSSENRALEQMCRVILNLNEFVYPD